MEVTVTYTLKFSMNPTVTRCPNLQRSMRSGSHAIRPYPEGVYSLAEPDILKLSLESARTVVSRRAFSLFTITHSGIRHASLLRNGNVTGGAGSVRMPAVPL